MGINSTEVSYGFGQLGSIFSDTTTTAMIPPTGKVFVAVHFLEETNLAASGGLVAANTTDIEFAGTVFARDADGVANDAAHDETTATADLGQGGTIIDNNNAIPAGTIIYGRYTQVKAATDKMIIAYIGQ